jgi:hypothetical protein
LNGAALGQVTIGTGQLLLACICLGSYAVALGRQAGPLGRVLAIVVATLAAVVLVAGFGSWEAGVILVAVLPIGVAAFAGAAWALWELTGGRSGHATSDPPPLAQPRHQAAESASTQVPAHAPAFRPLLADDRP